MFLVFMQFAFYGNILYICFVNVINDMETKECIFERSEFTDLCKNCVKGVGCKLGNMQCFGVACEDFEPYIADLN